MNKQLASLLLYSALVSTLFTALGIGISLIAFMKRGRI